jgi:hypothetical protein
MKKIFLSLSMFIAIVAISTSCKTSEQTVINDINKFCDIFHQLTISNDSLKQVNIKLNLQLKDLQKRVIENKK